MTAMTAATLDHLSDGRLLLGHRHLAARRWPRAGTASASRSSWPRTREYVEIVRMALGARAARVRRRDLHSCRCPTGPGKALKLMIAPVQERIPIYIAAIGPKNTQLAGEIADGWLPIVLLARARGRRRARCSRRAPRGPGARSTTASTSRPPCSVSIDDDVDRARDAMRPFARALRRRHGLAQEELLQRAGAALRVRGRGARRSRTCTSTARRTRPPPRSRRADRHGHAVRAARAGDGAAGRLPRRGRGHADRRRRWPSTAEQRSG